MKLTFLRRLAQLMQDLKTLLILEQEAETIGCCNSTKAIIVHSFMDGAFESVGAALKAEFGEEFEIEGVEAEGIYAAGGVREFWFDFKEK